MSNIKNPPSFNPEEGDDYVTWKQDCNVWRMVTKVEKPKHGPSVYLALKGSARDKIRSIDNAVLNSDRGFEEVIAHLDTVYLQETSTRSYMAFKEFVEYRRKSGDKFSVFIVKFEKLYNEIEKYDMKLPTGAKAYFLLQAANISQENERLARVTSKMEYPDMKTQTQKMFGEMQGKGEGSDTLPVKNEECHYTRDRGKYGNDTVQNEECHYTRGRGSYRGQNSNWRKDRRQI